ncbi:hypothetical protein BCU30_006490 [Vibrio lentus]|uniref:hypothetical protein n=1 Tax=Vibrio lentus TaxID=136468 RepID=UPI000C82BC81|nr:hypothetical protein [Vibrio lentus]PMG19088.1 hypothetical protein BCU96_09765 [Vibrio lentus]PMH16505.1 hypothetical protein BCU76_01035 [Vibrio lentus]PMJ12125.1 hypothetical protein BCU30_17760 [Vibrio lentus]PMK94965.1 hypothetical protein BCT89_14415 [Vibrio lentus]PMN17316.1 hypothetical protein BCT39_16210 [Vibrio lentus]
MRKLCRWLNIIAKRYEKLITIFFIGGLSLVISGAQLWVASSQVAMNETTARYNSYKTYPQIEVVRLADEADTVKIINRAGEWFDLQSKVMTILYAQTSSDSEFRKQYFVVKPIRSEFMKSEIKGQNTTLISKSEKSYQLWEKYQYDFSVENSDTNMRTAINLSTYVRLRYRNIYGDVSERYFMLAKPTMSTRESINYKEIFDTAFLGEKYQVVYYNQDVNEVIQNWVEQGR